MANLKHLIENNFSIILLLSLVFGLFLPGLDKLPDVTVIILVGSIIFFSCSKVSFAEALTIDKKSVLSFYLFRFILFPIALYFAALPLLPNYAAGILLIALMPAGVTAAGLAAILKGNVTLAFALTIFSSALAPFVVPAIFALTAGQSMEINIIDIFTTLALTIFVPAVLYFVIAKPRPAIQSWVNNQTKFMTVFLIGIVIAVLIASQREYFFSEPIDIAIALAIGFFLYALYYLVAWYYAKILKQDKVTYALCSGTNNLALATAVALLHFGPTIVLFTVVSEIAWVASLALFKRMIST